jgi:hypothetical protein
MSFDLYFLARQPGQSWEDAMAALEDDDLGDVQPLDDAAVQTWNRIKGALESVIPDAKEFAGETNRELDDDATGIQVYMFAGELIVTVPYWYTGSDAERVVEVLGQIAAKVEEATGLTAYDPQADAPFLGEGQSSAASTFERAHRALGDTIQSDASSESAGKSALKQGRASRLWASLFGREGN